MWLQTRIEISFLTTWTAFKFQNSKLVAILLLSSLSSVLIGLKFDNLEGFDGM